jgi:hypothetical protein
VDRIVKRSDFTTDEISTRAMTANDVKMPTDIRLALFLLPSPATGPQRLLLIELVSSFPTSRLSIQQCPLLMLWTAPHPVSAWTVWLLLKRNGIKRGIVTLCIGGGQGIALALEATA